MCRTTLQGLNNRQTKVFWCWAYRYHRKCIKCACFLDFSIFNLLLKIVIWNWSWMLPVMHSNWEFVLDIMLHNMFTFRFISQQNTTCTSISCNIKHAQSSFNDFVFIKLRRTFNAIFISHLPISKLKNDKNHNKGFVGKKCKW